ncbi:MAG: DNA-directed RNA polymerase subunit omega [Ezakiella sp.]|nr:DNA-directed RNA polymerase subunit omega [Ezakiella sp.]MDD7762016.1 DNA-directed RNA polymerase subunit omega [Bacillota bacterium]MDY3946557.1 DNA-directed RNA polymerase subunit omega [Ezakiella sp.]
MYNPSEKILGENVSRYTLVMVVAKRARQIVQGSAIKVDIDEENPITIALREAEAGKLEYKEAE